MQRVWKAVRLWQLENERSLRSICGPKFEPTEKRAKSMTWLSPLTLNENGRKYAGYKKAESFDSAFAVFMVGDAGFEPATPAV